jgi:hypothetical protein
MRLGRRVLACLLTLLVLGEVSGVARAFGPGATVHCCCGAHMSARPCPCPDCPAARVRLPHKREAARLDAARNCDGASADDPGVLQVLAALPSPPAIVVTSTRAAVALVAPTRLRSRTLDPTRPPP